MLTDPGINLSFEHPATLNFDVCILNERLCVSYFGWPQMPHRAPDQPTLELFSLYGKYIQDLNIIPTDILRLLQYRGSRCYSGQDLLPNYKYLMHCESKNAPKRASNWSWNPESGKNGKTFCFPKSSSWSPNGCRVLFEKKWCNAVVNIPAVPTLVEKCCWQEIQNEHIFVKN